MIQPEILKGVIAESPDRRSFVRKLGLAGAIVGAAAAPRALLGQTSTGITDADILNFALNLEYLEAEFYNIATSGLSLDQLGVNIDGASNIGVSVGGHPVAFESPQVQSIAQELAEDELTHVVLLQQAIYGLGETPIGRPPINLNALGFGFGSQADFLTLARIFEDIGVTAYGGAAPLITSSTILGYAARILAVEAAHSGNIRLLIDQFGISSPTLDGADIPPPPSGSKFFPTNGDALTAIRTPGQVLYLAYDGPNLTKGGFFPNGVNGSLNTSAAAAATIDGPTLMASPNPIPTSGALAGATTLTWNAPNSQAIQIRIGSPSGSLFTYNNSSGSQATGDWVTNGMKFYLQDATSGTVTDPANTLNVLTVTLS